MTALETDLAVEDINLSDLAFWTRPDRDAAFAKLRAEKPISFHPEYGVGAFEPGPGYWAVVTYDDVWHVSRHPKLFCSGQGTNIPDLPVELNEFFGSMINMDAPKHTRLRGLVQRGFTPKAVNQVEEYVRDKARQIVDEVGPKGRCDFVRDIAAALPLHVICDMMGIPAEDHQRIFDLSNTILGASDPEYGGDLEAGEPLQAITQAGLELYQYAHALGEDRLANPTDDITSQLMHAEVDGERLSAQEFGSFFILLVVAGNETTRNAISHGMKALTDNPDQRRIWMDDFEGVAPTAIEEIVRWATPVIHFRRTATEDTEIRCQKIAAGDKVVMWYNSANRDEKAFDDPFRFDVRRQPNDHLAFGGGGPHFCLGANLARREIKVMFDELFRRLPDLEITGEPEMLQSAFIHGIKRMPCEFTPIG